MTTDGYKQQMEDSLGERGILIADDFKRDLDGNLDLRREKELAGYW